MPLSIRGAQHGAACTAAALLATQEARERLTCKTALGLQVLELGECTSLRGKPAAAAILAIAQHGKLGQLALPSCLRERQGMVLALLKTSKDLRRLSASQLRYANTSEKRSSCRGGFVIALQQALAVAGFDADCCSLPAY